MCVHNSEGVLCVEWVGVSLSQPLLSAVLSSWLSGNIMCLWDAQRNSPVSPHWGQSRQLKTHRGGKKVQHGLQLKLYKNRGTRETFFGDRFLPFGFITSDLAMPCWPRGMGFLQAVSQFLWMITQTCGMWTRPLKVAALSLHPRHLAVVPGLDWQGWIAACQSRTVFGSSFWPELTGERWSWGLPVPIAACPGLGSGRPLGRTLSDPG